MDQYIRVAGSRWREAAHDLRSHFMVFHHLVYVQQCTYFYRLIMMMMLMIHTYRDVNWYILQKVFAAGLILKYKLNLAYNYDRTWVMVKHTIT